MLFNSLDFALFLPCVFALYWFVFPHRLRAQNALILAASYLFYGWWDWRFLSLIVLSSAVDYGVGLALGRTRGVGTRRLLLGASLVVNLGVLGFFKYYGFFVESLVEASAAAGIPLRLRTLQVILPVGISFYTFQTLSYTIDVYRGRIRPTQDALSFFSFVAFFPQLVAGPIERAAHLLPQFEKPRRFDAGAATDGMRLVLYGLFKKIIVADGIAGFVDNAFGNHAELDGASLLLGAIAFSFQIYCDFSGYSDIAIGVARLLGFDLMRNFAFPFFSRDIAEFWRRWHISLSTWFRDYLFIPLGGSRGSKLATARNILVVFTVSGLWHGAAWTFVIWGLLHALFYMPLLALGQQRAHDGSVASGRLLPSPREGARIGITFAMATLAFVFFRSPTLTDALGYLGGIFSASLFQIPAAGKTVSLWLAAFVIIEWVQRNRRHGLDIAYLPVTVRWLVYWGMAFAVLLRFQGEQAFIYFQF